MAVILFWSAQAESVLKGTLLLTAYGIGLGVPFLVIALGFEKIIPWIKKHSHISKIMSFVSGLLILGTGVLLLFDQLQSLSLFIIQLLNLNSISV